MNVKELFFPAVVAVATIAILARGTGPRSNSETLEYINYADLPQKRGAVGLDKPAFSLGMNGPGDSNG